MNGQRKGGFTLVEVLVAIALFSIVMVAIMTPMLGLFGFGRKSEDVLDTNTLAQQRLERARTLVAAHYASPTDFLAQLGELGVTCKNIGLYGKELKADCEDTAGPPPLRRLSITVNQNGQTLTSSVDVINQ